MNKKLPRESCFINTSAIIKKDFLLVFKLIKELADYEKYIKSSNDYFK